MPRRHSLMAAVVLAACACSDFNLTSPSAPASPLTAPSPVDTSGGVLANALSPTGDISIVDDLSGLTYTLNVNRREISTSDGRVLALTADQSATALALFEGTLQVDPAAKELASLTLAGGVVPDGCVNGCVEDAYSRLPRGDVFKTAQRQRVKSRLGTDAITRRFVPLSAFTADICSDLLVAAASSASNYQTHRTSFISDVLLVAVLEVVNGTLKFVAPPGSVAAVKFALSAAAHYQAQLEVAFLSIMWNSYQCSSRHIRVPYLIRDSGGGGGGARLCRDEAIDVSLDGGYTWFRVMAVVCQSH